MGPPSIIDRYWLLLIIDRYEKWDTRFSYQATTVITVGWSEVCSFLKVMRKSFTQFMAVCFHKITFHLLFTNYTITIKQTQKVTAIIILGKDTGCVLQDNFKGSVGAACMVSSDWLQKTMTCHSSNCFSIVWGQENAPFWPLLTSLPRSWCMTQF